MQARFMPPSIFPFIDRSDYLQLSSLPSESYRLTPNFSSVPGLNFARFSVVAALSIFRCDEGSLKFIQVERFPTLFKAVHNEGKWMEMFPSSPELPSL